MFQITVGHKSLSELLEKLLLVQEKLLGQNPETKHVLYPGMEQHKGRTEAGSAEEIPSDSEEEKSEGEEGREENGIGEDSKESLKLPCKRKHDMVSI